MVFILITYSLECHLTPWDDRGQFAQLFCTSTTLSSHQARQNHQIPFSKDDYLLKLIHGSIPRNLKLGLRK